MRGLVAACARRPGRVLAVAAVLVLAGTALALGLRPSAATSTLAGHGTGEYQATEEYHRRFGDDAVAVLVRGELPQLVLTENIDRLLGLEGCLSGNKPPGARFAYLFPNERSALIQVRLEPGLSDEARSRAIRLVREAVAMPQWRLQHGSYVVTGA